MNNLKQQLLIFGKTEINTLLITIFLSLLVLSTFIIGNYFIIFAAAILVSLIFIWQTPQAGFLASLLVTMIFGEHFSLLPLKIEETTYKIYALDFVLIFTFLVWLLQQRINSIKIKKILKQKKNICLMIFFIFIIFNFLRSLLASSADTNLALATFKNYSYLLVYFLVILMFKAKDDVIRIIKILLWAGVPLLGFVVYGLANESGLWSETTPGLRYLSGLHAYYLTFSLVGLLVLMVYKKYLWGKIKTFGIFVIQAAGIIGGMFRHLWLGVLSVVVVIFSLVKFQQKRQLFRIFLIIFLLIIFISLAGLWGVGLFGSEPNFLQSKFITSVTSRLGTLTQTGYLAESAAGWRMATWRIALEKFLSKPLLGIGFGQKFYFEYQGFVDLVDIRNIHNDFASLLVQLGLLGFIPFVLFNFYQIKDLCGVLKKQDDFYKPISLMLLSFWIISVFGIFFAIYLMFNGTSIFYWTVMGAITVLMNNEK